MASMILEGPDGEHERGQADPGRTLPPCSLHQKVREPYGPGEGTPGTDASIGGPRVAVEKGGRESSRSSPPSTGTPVFAPKVAPIILNGTEVAPSCTEWHRLKKVAPG